MGKTADLLQTFTNFLQQQNLQNSKLLLMVSGGVDSMVLLHVAQQVVKPEQLSVLHINHNARTAAESDANFVQNYCSKNNIECLIETLSTGYLPEAQWRQERQQRSTKACQTLQAARILTAHHATDLVETMVFRLTKGSGPSGLSPFDVSTKPFWQVPKSELLDYAKAQNLEWREDATNQDATAAERNLIRHEVLPALRKITPNLEKVFVRESQIFAQTSRFLKTAVSSPCWGELEGGWLPETLEKKSIPLSRFLKLPSILQTELLRQIAAKTPSQSELEDCLQWLLNDPAGKSQKMISGTQLIISRKEICWE